MWQHEGGGGAASLNRSAVARARAPRRGRPTGCCCWYFHADLRLGRGSYYEMEQSVLYGDCVQETACSMSETDQVLLVVVLREVERRRREEDLLPRGGHTHRIK